MTVILGTITNLQMEPHYVFHGGLVRLATVKVSVINKEMKSFLYNNENLNFKHMTKCNEYYIKKLY